jgi:uncharacterized protein
VFEAPDPVVWCPRGYAILVTDPRGCWNSEGGNHRPYPLLFPIFPFLSVSSCPFRLQKFNPLDATFQTPVEGADEYDLIEWAAKLDWCNGNIGLGGVSYLVQSQWMVAQMKPPSLKAIIAWEGWSDDTFSSPSIAIGFIPPIPLIDLDFVRSRFSLFL